MAGAMPDPRLPSQPQSTGTAPVHLGRYSFLIHLRIRVCVNSGGWLHTKTVTALNVVYNSFVDVINAFTTSANRHHAGRRAFPSNFAN